MDTVTLSFPFADRALARRLERAEAAGNARFVEARAMLAPDVGATWIEVAGAYAMFDGVASPLTQTFGLGLFESPTTADFELVEQFFADRGAPVCHEVSPLAGAETIQLLTARHYEPIEFTSVLYRPIDHAGTAVPVAMSPLRVRIAGPDEHDRWAATAAAGWSDFPELAVFMHEVGRIMAERSDTLLFLAEDDGAPMATAVLSFWEDVAVLAGASTLPAARGRGAQLALLDARLRAAQDHQCSLAMMGALPGSPSQRNAERNGFRIAYTRAKWQLAGGGPYPSAG